MLTTNKKDLQKFSGNINAHILKIIELQSQYKVLEILNELNKAKFDAVYKQIFNDNIFYLSDDRQRDGKEKGSRATEPNDMYNLNDEDFNKFLELANAEFYNRGLTNKDGTYTEETNAENKLNKLKREIVKFSIEILPDEEMKQIFTDATTPGKNYNYKAYEKLFELFMGIGRLEEKRPEKWDC